MNGNPATGTPGSIPPAAAIEATQGAIYDALFESKTMSGNRGVTVYGLPVDRVLEMLRTAGAITAPTGS